MGQTRARASHVFTALCKLQRARFRPCAGSFQLLEKRGREAQLHGPLGVGREVQAEVGLALAHGHLYAVPWRAPRRSKHQSHNYEGPQRPPCGQGGAIVRCTACQSRAGEGSLRSRRPSSAAVTAQADSSQSHLDGELRAVGRRRGSRARASRMGVAMQVRRTRPCTVRTPRRCGARRGHRRSARVRASAVCLCRHDARRAAAAEMHRRFRSPDAQEHGLAGQVAHLLGTQSVSARRGWQRALVAGASRTLALAGPVRFARTPARLTRSRAAQAVRTTPAELGSSAPPPVPDRTLVRYAGPPLAPQVRRRAALGRAFSARLQNLSGARRAGQGARLQLADAK